MSKNTSIADLINYISVDGSGNVVLSTGQLVATQNYVTTAVSNLVASAPSTLDTLNELATALGNDANFATTVATSIGTKLNLSGGTLTGALNGTSALFTDNLRTDTGLGIKYGSFVSTTGYLNLFSARVGSTFTINFKDGTGGFESALSFTNSANRSYTFPNADGTIALTSNLSSYLPLTGGTLTGELVFNYNTGGIRLNRTATSNYAGVYYSTAGTLRWFIGMRENLASNNYILYSEQIGQDVLTLNVATGAANVYGNISASNFSGSSSGTNTGDQTNISGNAATATILAGVNVTTNATSSWNPQSLTYQAFGQRWAHSSISGDTGDLVLWLRAGQYSPGATEVCMIIDGDYYAANGIQKVLHEGNYSTYSTFTSNVTTPKLFVGGNSWIVFNNEEGSWGIRTRTTQSTPFLGASLKNMIFSGGGVGEGFVFTGVGINAAMEVRNDGVAYVRERLGISNNMSTSNSKLTLGGGGVEVRYSEAPAGYTGYAWYDFVRIGKYGETGSTGVFPLSLPADAMGIHVNGSSDACFFGLISRGTGFNDYNTVLAWGDDGPEDIFQFRFNNGVIGTITPAGALTMSSSITANSDKRIKNNITKINNALDKISDISGVYYNRIDIETDKRRIGFIAQDIQKVLPEVVHYDHQVDRYSVAYGEITALLLEGIKELKAENDELREILNRNNII
jgi:hypothetical protein